MSRVILLAEDDPITREVIGTHLRQLGFLVDSTASTTEAARLGARRTYSALVFDRNLQGGDASLLVCAIIARVTLGLSASRFLPASLGLMERI